MNGSFEQAIRERAYALWMEHGQVEGRAHEHWLMAERDVLAAAAQTIAVKKARKVATAATKTTAARSPKTARASTSKVAAARA